MDSEFSDDGKSARLDSDDGILLNRATQGLYPPGSTIKPLILDAALRSNAATQNETFKCTGSLDVGDGHSIRESHGAVHGKVDLRHALMESCNVTFGTLAMRMEGIVTSSPLCPQFSVARWRCGEGRCVWFLCSRVP